MEALPLGEVGSEVNDFHAGGPEPSSPNPPRKFVKGQTLACMVELRIIACDVAAEILVGQCASPAYDGQIAICWREGFQQQRIDEATGATKMIDPGAVGTVMQQELGQAVGPDLEPPDKV